MNYWLIKSEPEVYSIDHLQRDKKTLWENVRNYQARNFMMKGMQLGDLAFFYHSNAEPSGIAGLCKVSKIGLPDPSQFDKKSDYFDKKATLEKPIWFCVEVSFVQKFKTVLALAELRNNSKLKELLVLKKGQRLSVQPVAKDDYEQILKMAKTP